jgi:hypothetical protein
MSTNEETLWEKRELEEFSTMRLINWMRDALTELECRSYEPLHLTSVEDETGVVTETPTRRPRVAYRNENGFKPENAHRPWTAEMVVHAQALSQAGWSHRRIGQVKGIEKSPDGVKKALLKARQSSERAAE